MYYKLIWIHLVHQSQRAFQHNPIVPIQFLIWNRCSPDPMHIHTLTLASICSPSLCQPLLPGYCTLHDVENSHVIVQISSHSNWVHTARSIYNFIFMQCTTFFLRGFPFHASDTSLYGLIPAHTDFPDTDTSRGFDWLNSAVKRVAQPHHPPRPPVDFILVLFMPQRVVP